MIQGLTQYLAWYGLIIALQIIMCKQNTQNNLIFFNNCININDLQHKIIEGWVAFIHI